MKLVIWPYKMGSRAAKSLAKSLGAKRVRQEGRFQPRRRSVVLNYGNKNKSNFYDKLNPEQILNRIESVSIASNKLYCFQALQSFLTDGPQNPDKVPLNIPDFTTEYQKAVEWSEKYSVVHRTTLTGSGGVGIYISSKGEQPVESVNGRPVQMWVKYIPKRREYRVHVFRGEAIDVQQKRKKFDAENVNTQVRNHDNGWVFARENVDALDNLDVVACEAVKAVGLDFGAVDIIWNEKQNKIYVLEINTAPGLEGTTIMKYCDAIKRFLN